MKPSPKFSHVMNMHEGSDFNHVRMSFVIIFNYLSQMTPFRESPVKEGENFHNMERDGKSATLCINILCSVRRRALVLRVTVWHIFFSFFFFFFFFKSIVLFYISNLLIFFFFFFFF